MARAYVGPPRDAVGSGSDILLTFTAIFADTVAPPGTDTTEFVITMTTADTETTLRTKIRNELDTQALALGYTLAANAVMMNEFVRI